MAVWQKVIVTTSMASHCFHHWEHYLKTLQCLYLTPLKLAKIYLNCSSCWRLCGDKGTLAHTLCFCKSLRSYWYQIFVLISDKSGHQVDPNPSLALLHIGVETFPPSSRSIIICLLLAATLNITRLWCTTNPPISNIISDLNLQNDMRDCLPAKCNISLYFGPHGFPTLNAL